MPIYGLLGIADKSARYKSSNNSMTKILAIGAHPDDVEFGCAPLLIKEVEKGNEVKILCLSLGEAGSSGTPEGRKQEAIDAAKIIGAEIEFLDPIICHSEQERRQIAETAQTQIDAKYVKIPLGPGEVSTFTVPKSLARSNTEKPQVQIREN